MRPIFLLGGGSGGHIQPNIAIAEALRNVSTTSEKNPTCIFICSRSLLDRSILSRSSYPFIQLWSGKIQRYFSFRHFIEWFLVLMGFFQSLFLLLKHRPAVVFSKGGYVAVPMVFAAWLFRVPVVLHESDTISGIANRLVARFAKKICLGFPISHPKPKMVYTGNPLRHEILTISEEIMKQGYELTGFDPRRPVILIMGGSQGALFINQIMESLLPQILEYAQIIHITGPGKQIQFEHPLYRQYEYVKEELPAFYAITTLAISRAGANSLAELAFCGIPAILIPLPSAANQHQKENADFFAARGAAVTLAQHGLRPDILEETIRGLLADSTKRNEMSDVLHTLAHPQAAREIAREIIELYSKGK